MEDFNGCLRLLKKKKKKGRNGRNRVSYEQSGESLIFYLFLFVSREYFAFVETTKLSNAEVDW